MKNHDKIEGFQSPTLPPAVPLCLKAIQEIGVGVGTKSETIKCYQRPYGALTVKLYGLRSPFHMELGRYSIEMRSLFH